MTPSESRRRVCHSGGYRVACPGCMTALRATFPATPVLPVLTAGPALCRASPALRSWAA